MIWNNSTPMSRVRELFEEFRVSRGYPKPTPNDYTQCAAVIEAWETWKASAKSSSDSAMHACITYVIHGDADFSDVDEGLSKYFREKVRTRHNTY